MVSVLDLGLCWLIFVSVILDLHHINKFSS